LFSVKRSLSNDSSFSLFGGVFLDRHYIVLPMAGISRGKQSGTDCSKNVDFEFIHFNIRGGGVLAGVEVLEKIFS
jgi:hypothetical protein